MPASPVETSFTHSDPLPLKYEVAVALRRSSRLFCWVPADAVVNPGSSKITQEPASVRERYGDEINAQSVLMARRLVERGVRTVLVLPRRNDSRLVAAASKSAETICQGWSLGGGLGGATGSFVLVGKRPAVR